MKNSRELFEAAKKRIPGGVNSPVRAFRGVGGEPFFVKSAKGYGERKGISYAAWREVGVSAATLKAAGISRGA